MYIRQRTLIKRYLSNHNISTSKAVATPLPHGYFPRTNLGKASSAEIKQYQTMIGELLYLSRCTRPDISTSVNRIARMTSNPSEEHLNMLKRIYQYLNGTIDLGLRLGGNITQILAFTDADHASDLVDRSSTSGRMIFLGRGPVIWGSSKQDCVSTSTKEAEYVAASACSKDALWLKGLLSSLNLELPAKMYCDSVSAISSIKNGDSDGGRSKHIDIKHHHIRKHVKDGDIDLQYVETTSNITDIMTKPLPKGLYHNHRQSMALCPIQSNRR